MYKRLVLVLVGALVLSLFPSSATLALRARLPVQLPPAGTSGEPPSALAQAGVTAALLGTADLTLSPTSQARAVNDIFTIALMIVAGTQPVDTADTYIHFDPSVLRVVDDGGNEVAAIESDLDTFSTELYNSADNNTGQISYSSGILVGTPPSGTFRIATIRFRRIASSTTTTVSYQVGSDVFFAANSVLGTLVSAEVTGPVGPRPQVHLPLVLRYR